MRACKLITLSAAAVLMGGGSLAFGAAAPQTGGSMQKGSAQLQKHQSIGPAQRGGVYGRATGRELGEAGTPPNRPHLREMMRDIPRLSSVGSTDMRIDGVVAKKVQQAAAPLPPDVLRQHPHLRNDRAFMYRDQVAILNPRTSRIVALIKSPT